MKKYCLVSDDSGHDYVIPTNKRNEWYDFDFEDYDFNLPDWAIRVEGGLEFENPTEDGKELFDWIKSHGTEIFPPNTDGKMMQQLFKGAEKNLTDLQFSSALDMNQAKILNEFVQIYNFNSIQDLKDKLDYRDIMANVLDLAKQLNALDTADHKEAMKLIDNFNKWKLLHEFINIDYDC